MPNEISPGETKTFSVVEAGLITHDQTGTTPNPWRELERETIETFILKNAAIESNGWGASWGATVDITVPENAEPGEYNATHFENLFLIGEVTEGDIIIYTYIANR